MKTSPFLIAAFTVALSAYALPNITHAGEIHYSSLKDQRDNTLLIQYKSPEGAEYFTCGIETKRCKSRGSTTPIMFPTLLGSKVYPKSADGRLAVKPFVVGSITYHFLYDISSKTPKKLTLIPYIQVGAKIHFSKNNNAVIFQKGTTFTRYDIKTRKISSVTLAQNLAFLSISPSATFVTGYNYGTLEHELWSFSNKRKYVTPSSMQSYLELSEDETRLAFLEDVDSFKTLFTMKTSDLGKTNPSSLKQLTKPKTETEDYLFVNNTLYFLANVEGPLDWHLYSYLGGNIELIEEDVSYGDFLKRVRGDDDNYLAYLKTTGKNTNVVLLSPGAKKGVTFSPIKNSPLSTEVEREVVTYGKRTGVLLSPKDGGDRNSNLFIWMHGGPQRQVAKAYHPYLSYAVYDELLERLVEGGNYVFKIDYTGSSGYGADFRKALDMKIGNIEIADIANAIEDIEDDIRIDDVYLIGNSYGGYMALRGVVDMPKNVDGAISINGVSDWYGLIQQIPSSPFKALFNGVPDTHNLDEYFKASVFLGMENLTSRDKVLVVWGEEDRTVPTWQSTKYIEYAETQGVNVEALSFPGEEHIFRDRSTLDTLCNKITSFFRVRGVSCSI